MNKNLKKVISILMTAIMLLSCLSFVFAADIPTIGDNQLGNGAQGFVSGVLGTIRWVAYAIAIGMLIWIGIKYVMAGAAEKADVKGLLVKYVIGAVLIAAAGGILGWIADAGQQITQ